MNKKYWVLILLIVVGAIECTSLKPRGGSMSMTKEDILRVATQEAKKLGFSIDEMMALNPESLEEQQAYYQSIYSKNNILPEFFLKDWRKRIEALPQIGDQLKGRNYVAVYFGPKRAMLGGDLTVFIDKKTGEVITYLKGK